MSRAIRYVPLTVAGLIVGSLVGFGLGHRSFDEGTEMLSDILALGEYETLASLQYKETDTPHARQALLGLLEFMDEMEVNNRGRIQKEMYLDRGVAYMRLALLEEKSGNISGAKDYVQKAQESLKKRDGNDVSENKLRELVTKFDSTPTYKLPGIFLLSKGL